MTINDEIVFLRNKLNKSIVDNRSYDEIYKLSEDLDKLISTFYKNKRDIID